MFNKLKDCYTKKNFNIEEDFVNMLNYHYILHWFLTYTGLKPGGVTWQSKLLVFLVTFSGTIAFALCVIPLCHFLSEWDLSMATESGTYLFITGIWIFVLLLNLKEKESFLVLQSIMLNSFNFVRRKGGIYRARYFELQLVTWKASFAALSFMVIASSSLIVQNWMSLVYYTIKHVPGDGIRRKHIFPLWLPMIDVTETPYYEVLCVSSYLFLLAFGVVMSQYLVAFIVWVGQMYIKAEMVALGLRGLLVGLVEPTNDVQLLRTRAVLKSRMRDIVQQHYDVYSLMYHFVAVFRKLLMYQQLATVPVACLTAFVFAESIGSGAVNPNMFVVFGTASLSLFVLSYIFTLLNTKLSSLIEECGAVEWWTLGAGASCVRTDLQLVMIRALVPPSVRCPGLREVSLETFSSAMASAYSYFNMLRQMS